MILGTSADGRALTYEHSRYEFKLAEQVISFDDVCTLESRDWIRWRAPELREWFVKINRDAMIACNRAAAQAASKAAAPARKGAALRYRSTNPSVATVDEAGKVHIRGAGEADILAARLEDAKFVSAVRLVTVAVEEPLEKSAQQNSQPADDRPALAERPAVAQSSRPAEHSGDAQFPSSTDNQTAVTQFPTITKGPAVAQSPAVAQAVPSASNAEKPRVATREARASLKAKGGSLAKEKTFKLPNLPEGARAYEKVSGSASMSVSPSGKITMAKGTPLGIHTAEIVVRGDDSQVMSSVVVSVEVK